MNNLALVPLCWRFVRSVREPVPEGPSTRRLMETLGAEVRTIEGLNGKHVLQQAFACEGGAQCGICTPGMIMAAAALPRGASEDAMREGLAGNLCRCTGYSAIYRSIRGTQGAATGRPEAPARKKPRRGARRKR